MYRAYLVYGLLILAGMAYAEYRGMSLLHYDEVRSVPRSIRNNPGAYRGLYRYDYFHK